MVVSCEDYVPILLKSISVDSILNFDLYSDNCGSMCLYRRRNVAFTQDDIEALVDYGHEYLYVPRAQEGQLAEFLKSSLPILLADDSISAETKLNILTETSVGILTAAFDDPEEVDSIRSVIEHCGNLVCFARSGEEQQRSLVGCSPDAPFCESDNDCRGANTP